MRKLITLIVALAAVAAYEGCSRPHVPALLMNAIQADVNDPCHQKALCFVAYVAPWCPSCRRASPGVVAGRAAFRDRFPDRGVKIIVGADNTDRLESYARELGEGAIIDGAGIYKAALSVNRFPTFWLIDANGKIVKTGQDAFAWLQAETRARP